ncbi:uncharacterized protein LOC116172246 isoform X1 [Photinus pyralis]|uniref:uncharacterized protein LOC116172246 isoform X1 n=1 Tax=Photinus pyralis TaxID=7054 RepID=UPI00126705E4|nr:uncharacterized protein LOC116172246 isoform X1 [Photinus pyralis]
MARRFRRSGAGCRHVRLTIITLNEHKIGGILIRSNPKIHSRAVLCPRRVNNNQSVFDHPNYYVVSYFIDFSIFSSCNRKTKLICHRSSLRRKTIGVPLSRKCAYSNEIRIFQIKVKKAIPSTRKCRYLRY